ncbi:MAG: GNAT family N-acetyltransferase [Pelagimonas sp.]|uniref:GNAT family N-acetyltransferase n=1 Tax=Pelagimonas sp. TaxID=2073170 RepID=UPI003D6A4342
MPLSLTFARLPQVPLTEILTHMNDPRLAEHMPLLTSKWGVPQARQFVASKEACWARDGLGHWAFYADDHYVGWGGFQREGDDWDFGLVLRPERFGLGPRIARQALAVARSEPHIPYVTFLLPPSRRNLSALRRIGAEFVGDVDYNGELFRKYRLETA